MLAQVLAIVAAAETVGAQRLHTPGEPWRELVGDDLHVIAGGDDRAFGALERLHDVRSPGRFGGVQAVPALDVERLASQLVIAGYAPHVGGDLVFLRQNRLRAQSLIQYRA